MAGLRFLCSLLFKGSLGSRRRACSHNWEVSLSRLPKDTTVAHRLLVLLVAAFLASALLGEEADSAPEISADRIKAGVAYLASDMLEGRGPGTRGEILATEYIAEGFKNAGLKPDQVAAINGGTAAKLFRIQ